MTNHDQNQEVVPADDVEFSSDDTPAEEAPRPPAETFSELIADEEFCARLASLGFTKPTEVQSGVIPYAAEGRDMLVQAQTGSGKTLAFSIPMVQRLEAAMAKKEVSDTFALVVAPTRELALQVREVVSQINPAVEPALLIGGVDSDQQTKSLQRDRRVVVGTPGRILDMMRQRKLKLNRCRYFVLDEADEMLSMGFIEDVRAILSRLPEQRQGLFVSATLTGRVELLASSFLKKPKRVSIGEYTSDTPPIEHYYCEVGGELMAKPQALCDLIETVRPRSAIIFCNTKSDTELVEVLLRRRGFDARRINSDLSQNQRDRIMKKIRADELRFLIATDIAARGLDIEQIDLVINYSIHEQPETYIHRTGRTGRAGRSGRAVSLVGPKDHGYFFHLKNVLEFELKQLPLPSDTEVVDARVAHLYEMLRSREIKISERDMMVARRLIEELGGQENAAEELAEVVSKLCRYTTEHFISLDAESLEEEIGSGEDTRREKQRDKGKDGGRKDRDKRDRRSDRRESRQERGQESRGRSQQGGGHDRWEEGGSQPREGSEYQNGSAPRGGQSSDEDDTPTELRLYIGQGTNHGMTASVFTDIASEFAEISQDQLRKLTIRENYGYVDLYEPQARALMRSLSNFEFNGYPLPLEQAAVLHQRRNAGGQRRGSGGRDRQGSGGRGGRGRDNRRGGGRGERRGDDRRGGGRGEGRGDRRGGRRGGGGGGGRRGGGNQNRSRY